MGFFQAYLGGSNPTKYLTARRVIDLIMCVKRDVGISGLIAGRIVLKGDFTVAFCSRERYQDFEIHASVNLRVPLEKLLAESDMQDYKSWGLCSTPAEDPVITDRLTYAVITEFERQSPTFRQLPSIFKSTSDSVVLCWSAQFKDAKEREDRNAMESLLQQGGETHYLMEVHDTPGVAAVRLRKIANDFAGGMAIQYEEPFK